MVEYIPAYARGHARNAGMAHTPRQGDLPGILLAKNVVQSGLKRRRINVLPPPKRDGSIVYVLLYILIMCNVKSMYVRVFSVNLIFCAANLRQFPHTTKQNGCFFSKSRKTGLKNGKSRAKEADSRKHDRRNPENGEKICGNGILFLSLQHRKEQRYSTTEKPKSTNRQYKEHQQ